MEGEIASEFHRIYNGFPSIEISKTDIRAFDYLPFSSKMNLQRSMISIFKNSQSETHRAVERTSLKTKLLSYSNYF